MHRGIAAMSAFMIASRSTDVHQWTVWCLLPRASSSCWPCVVLRGLVVVAITARYKGYRYPIEVIGHAVWLYHRFAPEKPLGRHRVTTRLHQYVEHVAVLVDRAPQVIGSAVDFHEDVVEVAICRRGGARGCGTCRECWSPTSWPATSSPTASWCRR